VFHEKNFTKIQVSNTGIEVFSFSKKLLKKYGKCFLKKQWLQNRLWDDTKRRAGGPGGLEGRVPN